jgi:hypothetical protein
MSGWYNLIKERWGILTPHNPLLLKVLFSIESLSLSTINKIEWGGKV